MDWLHIDTWLSTLYKEQDNGAQIPYFERTNKNYDLLNNLVNLNLNSTKLVENIINNYSAKETHVIDNSNSNKGEEEQRALNSLALIAQSLGLGTTETSNYYTAITKLSLDQMELDIQENQLVEMEYIINQCQKDTNDELIKLKGMLNNLQNNKNKNDQQKSVKQGDTTTLKQKTSEYLLLEKKYHDLGIERKGIKLNHIQEIDLKANSLENELKEKNETLSSYQVLPSEMVLASIKIQETEDQLHDLEYERENLLSDIAKSVL